MVSLTGRVRHSLKLNASKAEATNADGGTKMIEALIAIAIFVWFACAAAASVRVANHSSLGLEWVALTMLLGPIGLMFAPMLAPR